MNNVETLIRAILSATKVCILDGELAKSGVIPGGGGITPTISSRREMIGEYIE
jgi:hypothetical protein